MLQARLKDILGKFENARGENLRDAMSQSLSNLKIVIDSVESLLFSSASKYNAHGFREAAVKATLFVFT